MEWIFCPIGAFNIRIIAGICSSAAKMTRRKKYWADQLSAPPQPLELPTDRPRQKAFDYAGAKLHFTLGERQSTACERYCEQNGLSPYMLFSAAFGLVLSRLSGQSDFLIGTPVSGRTSPQLWQVLGAFIHTLPLRLRPEPQLGISAYLEQVRQSVLQMIEHQDCSLEALQKLYQQAGGQEGALYRVMFSYRPVSEEDFALHGEKMQYIPIETATSKLDLSLEAAKTAGHFEFFLEYATALFDEASMQLFSRSYCAALAELVGGEAGSLAEVTALAAADRIALYEKPCRMRMPT